MSSHLELLLLHLVHHAPIANTLLYQPAVPSAASIPASSGPFARNGACNPREKARPQAHNYPPPLRFPKGALVVSLAVVPC